MLRKLGPQKWVFDELAGLSKVQFRFKDKEKPQSYVCRLASLLQYYPMEEVISGDYAFKEWRPDLVISILDRLIPDNIRLVSIVCPLNYQCSKLLSSCHDSLTLSLYYINSVAVIGKKFESLANSKETWYGTLYKSEKIDPKDLETWKNAGLSDKLQMPPRNEFIPEQLELVPREDVITVTTTIRLRTIVYTY